MDTEDVPNKGDAQNEEGAKEKEAKKKEQEKITKMDPKGRSKLSLEGAKGPLSLYTRRVIDTSKIYEVLKENSSHGVCGGRNLGNTCFMNSSIACLSNCTELTYYFLKNDYVKDINKENKLGLEGKLAQSWRELLEEYWVENNDYGIPSKFKGIMGSRAHIFSGYGQQDSNEFMSYFIDFMNEELNGTTKKPYIEVPEKDKNESDEECSKRFWEANLNRNDSIITDLFCGQFKSTIICPECNWVSVTFDPFYTLNLPIVDKTNANLIEDLDLFYVCDFGLKAPLRLKFDVKSNLSIDENIKELKALGLQSEDYRFFCQEISTLCFSSVNNKLLKSILDPSKTFDDSRNSSFIFAYNHRAPNETLPFPLYFKIKEGRFSEYPRLVFFGKNATFLDVKKSVFKYGRRIFLGPLGEVVEDGKEEKEREKVPKNLEEDQISRKIYLFNKSEDTFNTSELEKYIDKEFDLIFNNRDPQEKADKIKDYIENLPFSIYLEDPKDKEETVVLLDKEHVYEVSEKLRELTGIENNESKVGKLMDVLSGGEDKVGYRLILEIDYDSTYLNKIFANLNSCVLVNIHQPRRRHISCNLGDCLSAFSQPEKLKRGNEWYCKNCKRHVLAIKKMELYYIPKLLIICFKRFTKHSYRWEKNDEDVDFPVNNADFKEHVVGPDKEHSVYDLFAVSQHYGGTWGGHYTAMAKNLGIKWYSYNDSSCHSDSENSVHSSAAYVLFYRRQTD